MTMLGVFEGIHFTGDFVKSEDSTGQERHGRLTKGEVRLPST
jgi:hypothetical protein